MKMRTLILTLATALWLAAQPAPSPAVKPAEKPPEKPPAGVPPQAKFVEESTWRYVDANGKAWIYKKSPFGMSKSTEMTAEEQQKRDGKADPVDGITVKVENDLLRFSRPGPFGVYTWTKKKSDLTDVEKAVWERVQPSNSGDKE